MRYAIISDIHANLSAFTAVLKDIEQQGGVEKVWCLGDIVDYGPQPHECIKLLGQTDNICVAGNHDLAAIGKADPAAFNPDAVKSCRWTVQHLRPADIHYLNKLPSVVQEGDFTLVHASPRDPVWEYLTSTAIAQENLAHFKSPFCLVGHSHLPLVFSFDESGACSAKQFPPSAGLVLGSERLIINPGSVGQPRDGDPRASYAIYDRETNQISLHRVPYDIYAPQEKMVKQGLPWRLVARLSYGV